jgi:hypothetical protein
VFVDFSGSSGKVLVMIEPLADKTVPAGSREWLNTVEHATVLAPILSEEWIFIDGALALRVVNGDSDPGTTEAIYILNGVKTFAVRFPHIEDPRLRSVCRQMLSTFRFSAP